MTITRQCFKRFKQRALGPRALKRRARAYHNKVRSLYRAVGSGGRAKNDLSAMAGIARENLTWVLNDWQHHKVRCRAISLVSILSSKSMVELIRYIDAMRMQ